MLKTNHKTPEMLLKPSWTLTLAAIGGLSLLSGTAGAACNNDDEFTSEFRVQDCQFEASGENPYFILNPGYQLVLADEEVRLQITALPETQDIQLDGQNITTRVVEEREYVNDVLIELSRNFFAICTLTNDVYYFGEDVYVCEDGFVPGSDTQCVSGEAPANPGQWRVGEYGAQPGIIMPGTYLLGAKYFQEVAFPIAADRGEHTGMGLHVEVPAGIFDNCVEITDTNSVEKICNRNRGDTKVYCPGVGLTVDQDLGLVEINIVNGD